MDAPRPEQRPQAGPGRGPRCFALMNQKGGVGKSTTAVNLAAALARLGRRVLLVDLDPQAHATLHLSAAGQPADQTANQPAENPADASAGQADAPADAGDGVAPTVYDALLDPASARAVGAGENLWLLPSETDLAAVEGELARADGRHHRLRRAIEGLAPGLGIEIVLIDCPPSLGLLTLNGLAAADEVIIPMQAHFLALHGVGKLLETVRLVSQQVRPGLRVAGVVLCMYDQQASHTQEVVGDIEAFFAEARGRDVPWRDARVLWPPIRRNIKLAEAPSFGQSIFDYAPQAAGARDYAALARHLAALVDPPASSVVRTNDGNAPADDAARGHADHGSDATVRSDAPGDGGGSAPGAPANGGEAQGDDAVAEVRTGGAGDAAVGGRWPGA